MNNFIEAEYRGSIMELRNRKVIVLDFIAHGLFEGAVVLAPNGNIYSCFLRDLRIKDVSKYGLVSEEI